MDEEDLFGGDGNDLYGDFHGQQDSLGRQDSLNFGIGAGQPEHVASAGNDQPSSRHSNDADSKVKELQKKLMESLMAADRWRTAFKEIATMCGFSAAMARDPDVHSVLEAVQRTRASEQALQDEVKALRRREAALQIQLADRNLEGVDLRRELNTAWAAADPNVVQMKQLLLDPALNKEFNRMKAELESTQKELKHVQEELVASTYTQESKIGRQLVAKCRALADENEEMGRELAEGKMHALETQLAMAKDYAADIRSSFVELEEHCCMLDDEAEELQREVFALRREALELKGEPMGPGGMHGDGFMGRRDGPHMGPGGFRGGRGGRGGMIGTFKRPPPPGLPPGVPPGRFMDSQGPKRFRQ